MPNWKTEDCAERRRTNREQQRTLERQLQEAQFALRTLVARREELARSIAIAAARRRRLPPKKAVPRMNWLTDAMTQGQFRLLNAGRATRLPSAAGYDDLTHRLRSSDAPRRAGARTRSAAPATNSAQRASRAAGFEQCPAAAFDAQTDLAAGLVHRVRQCPHQRAAGEMTAFSATFTRWAR
jgi:chromosome segregation protein